MNPETRRILNDPELLEIQAEHFRRMQEVFDGGNVTPPYVLSGVYDGVDRPEKGTAEEQMHRALDALAAQADVLRDRRVFRPLSFNISTYGEDYSEYLFGLPRMDPANPEIPHLKTPVGELDPPSLDGCPGWQNAKAQTELFLSLELKVPVFTGVSITSPLVEAVNLYDERFLIAMLADPEAARHDLRVLADVQIEMRRWFIEHVPVEQLQGVAPRLRGQPPGYGQIDGCTHQLISPDLYREMVADLDAEVLSLYPKGGMIHICGWHTHHIPIWREMKPLKVLQLSGDSMTDLEQYFHGLREDQVVYVSPHATMPLDRIVEITRGKRTIIALYPRDLHLVPTVVDGRE